MRILYSLIFLSYLTSYSQNSSQFQTPYEKGNGNQTATYEELIAFYQLLDKQFETVKMIEMGLTDSGEPLHLVLFDVDKKFELDVFLMYAFVSKIFFADSSFLFKISSAKARIKAGGAASSTKWNPFSPV